MNSIVRKMTCAARSWWAASPPVLPRRDTMQPSHVSAEPREHSQRAESPERQEEVEAIDLAAQYLCQVCGPDGQFEYRVNLNPRVHPKPKYNVLRHAGTIYALSRFNTYWPDDNSQQAIMRAARFMQGNLVSRVNHSPRMLAVWSPPELERVGQPRRAKLGGTGLGLVALAAVHTISPGSVDADHIHKLARFLAFMQRKDGSFFSRYDARSRRRQGEWISLYYPGEAALGLLCAYEITAHQEWLERAVKALLYLAQSREGHATVPADHWALLATAKLWGILGRGDTEVISDTSKAGLMRHAIQVCESILAERHTRMADPMLVGCWFSDGRTTPTATRLEGLLAALSFLPEEAGALISVIEDIIPEAIGFLIRAQVEHGPYRGGIVRRLVGTPGYLGPNSAHPPDKRDLEVRIDYVQHAMCAMIQYLEWVTEGDPASVSREPTANAGS